VTCFCLNLSWIVWVLNLNLYVELFVMIMTFVMILEVMNLLWVMILSFGRILHSVLQFSELLSITFLLIWFSVWQRCVLHSSGNASTTCFIGSSIGCRWQVPLTKFSNKFSYFSSASASLFYKPPKRPKICFRQPFSGIHFPMTTIFRCVSSVTVGTTMIILLSPV
jgi:hypothetical protein